MNAVFAIIFATAIAVALFIIVALIVALIIEKDPTANVMITGCIIVALGTLGGSYLAYAPVDFCPKVGYNSPTN